MSPAPLPTKAPAAAKPAAATQHKVGANPNRQLFKRSTYEGVADIGPVAGETFAQKVERLKKVSVAAKLRQEAGGGPIPAEAVEAAAPETAAAPVTTETAVETAAATVESTVASPKAAVTTKTGQADRTLMKRYTYCGVVDTGPLPGETFEQKCERLRAVSAAAKQRADEGEAH